jgi:hypothetical protein
MTKPSAPILATPANMRTAGGYGIFAYDRYSKEAFSADAGDYYMQPDDRPLTGMFGKPLILARRVSYVEAL